MLPSRRLRVLTQGLLLIGILIGLFGVTGCVTADSARVRDVLDANLVTFEPGDVPDVLVDALAGRRVVLLGETHYVQEHQEFVLELLKRLHSYGLRWFTQEMSHAYGWIVEDYVRGDRNDYPDSVRRMDEYWVEGLRAFNEGLPASDRIGVRYIDMNHPPDALILSLWWMVRGTEIGERVGPIVEGVLDTQPGTDAYAAALSDLDRRLVSERDRLEESLGLRWYRRLAEAVEIEIRSLPMRARRDVHAREQILIDLAMRTIDDADGSSVAINVGMFHAQLRRYMGTRQEWLGEYLAANADRFGGPEQLHSLAFWGFSGERVRTFMDTDPQPVPAAMQRSPSNLSRQIAEIVARRDGSQSPESGAFVDLSHSVFSRRMRVAFTFSALRAAPGMQFDAYVIFPEITVLESMRRTW